jgi:hypothetical protein
MVKHLFSKQFRTWNRDTPRFHRALALKRNHFERVWLKEDGRTA